MLDIIERTPDSPFGKHPSADIMRHQTSTETGGQKSSLFCPEDWTAAGLCPRSAKSFYERKRGCCLAKRRRAPSFPKAPFIFSMAISRILSANFSAGMIIYLSRPAIAGSRARSRMRGTVMRRYPRIKRAGCPSSVLSCTAWGFSCLANYSASGELLPRLFTLACTLLPKNRRCLFCDTLRHRSFSTAAPARFTRHAAVWCSDFPLTSRKRLASDHLPSANNLSQRAKKKTPKAAAHPETRAC